MASIGSMNRFHAYDHDHPVLMPSPVHAILGIGYDAGNDNSCRTVANRDNSKLMIRRENFVVAD